MPYVDLPPGFGSVVYAPSAPVTVTPGGILVPNGGLGGVGGSGSASGGNTLHQPGNKINDQTKAGGAGTIEPTGTGPKWLQIAQGELKKGIKEYPGSGNNPEVLKYGKKFGFTTDGPSHPWCSAFVTWCLEQAGCSVQGLNGMAKSHLTAGAHETITEPILGCIAIYHRGSNAASGHVAFWVGRSGGRDKILGGNQSDAVTITTSSTQKLVGYRWPKGQPKPTS